MKKIIILLMFCSMLFADKVEFKENNITNSTIIVFNGKKFDLTKSGFFDYIKKYPQIEKNLTDYFGKRLDKVDRTNSEILKMVKKLANNQDTAQLQTRLDKLISEKKKLLATIEKLKQETSSTAFKAILTKAQEYFGNHQYDKYHEVLREFRAKKKEEIKREQQEMAQSAYLEAEDYNTRLEYEKAKELYQEAIEIEPKNGLYLSEFSTFLLEYGDYPNSLSYAKKALKIREEIYKNNLNHPNLATSYSNMGLIYQAMGDHPNALSYAKKALKIWEEIYKDNLNHPNLATSYNNMGLIYKAMGDYPNALSYAKKALKIMEGIYKDNLNHPNLATSYNNMGLIYQDMGDYPNALSYAKKALKIMKEIYKDNLNHPNLATSYNNMGQIYQAMGDYPNALSYAKKALKIREEIYKENLNYPNLATSYNNIGAIYQAMGDHPNALSYTKKALKIRETLFKQNQPKHPYLIGSYGNIAVIYRDMNNSEMFEKYKLKYLEGKR